MPDPLPALVDNRSTLLRRMAELGDFQPGSITSTTRRCLITCSIVALSFPSQFGPSVAFGPMSMYLQSLSVLVSISS